MQTSKYASYTNNLKQELIRPSIFDDFSRQDLRRFWQPAATLEIQNRLISKQNISGVLLHASNKGNLKEKKYSLADPKLVCYDADGRKATKFTDLTNATIEKVKIQNGDQVQYGFRVTRNKIYKQFMTTSEPVADVWISMLKKHCIQRQFQNQYDILKLVGKGGYAKVYSVRHKKSQQIFAAKIFQKEKFDQGQDKAALIKEVSILRHLQHKNIIRLYEVYENEQFVYLVFDLMAGGEFLKCIKPPLEITEAFVAQVIYNILSALEYLHDLNIMHRDIKPQNLMLKSNDDQSEIILADFGIADYYNSEGNYLFTRCGTPGYVAPEILTEKPYTHKVDVFGAGVIMFIMLTGVSPFDDSSTKRVLERNLECTIDFTTNDLPTRLTATGMSLLKAMLDPVQEQRISAADALQHTWFQQVSSRSPHFLGVQRFEYPSSLCKDQGFLYGNDPIQHLSVPITAHGSQPLSNISILSPNVEIKLAEDNSSKPISIAEKANNERMQQEQL